MTREPWPPRPHDAANQEKLAWIEGRIEQIRSVFKDGSSYWTGVVNPMLTHCERRVRMMRESPLDLADGDDEIRSMAEALGWRESEGME
jgi:hypothetical protein